MPSALSTLKTYWATNSTMNTALPASKVFLDYVPPGISFPYCRLSVINCKNEYMTAETHVEFLRYQLSFFHTDLDSLTNTVTAIAGVLDKGSPSANTLINSRENQIITGEVINGVYTYHYMLEYEWSYNSGAL